MFNSGETVINYQLAREELVQSLRVKGIRDDRVLEAIGEVKRHQFVPPNLRARAYEDVPLPIGNGQTISQPYMVARMTELLELTGKEKVLEIGTGSGYQAAILAKLATKVFTVERITGLAKTAQDRLEKMDITNILHKVGDGTLGWREFAPYECIMVTAGTPAAPISITDQLAEAGKLVIPIGPRRVQDLKLITKQDGKPVVHSKGGCIFVPLVGSGGWTSQDE